MSSGLDQPQPKAVKSLLAKRTRSEPELKAVIAETLANPAPADQEKLVTLLNELTALSAKNHTIKDQRLAQLEQQVEQQREQLQVAQTLRRLDTVLLQTLTAGTDITELQQQLAQVSGQETLTLLNLTSRHTVRDTAGLGTAEQRLLHLSNKQQVPAAGADDNGCPILVAAAKRGGELVGAVLIHTPDNAAVREIAARCAEILAAFVVAERRLRGDLAVRRQELLELVLDPPAGGLSNATQRRLAAHGITQDHPFRIVVGIGNQQALEAMDHRLEFDFGSRLLRGIIGGELVLVINEKNFVALRETLAGQRRRAWQGMVMGHSPRLHRIEIVPPELAVIRRVVAAAAHSRRSDSDVLVSLESYGVLGAFLSRVNIEPTKVAMRETLAPLLEYDEKHKTELVKTAYNFFNEGRNIAAIAQLMHVHENTVRQRLERIAGLLGPEWCYGQAGLDYHIMLSLLRVLEDE